MRAAALPSVLLLLLTACRAVPPATDAGTLDGGSGDAGGPQETYTYPGCANEDGSCPRQETVLCALETLRKQSAACTTAADCVRADVAGRCTAYGFCPPAFVNVAHKAEFEAAAAAEIDRYCPTSGGCLVECNPVPNPIADCVDGLCGFRFGSGQ